MFTVVGRLASLVLLALAVQDGARAQPYPSRAIRIVVAFPAGGGSDLAARVVGQKLSESLGQPVVVENRVGANGSVGAEAVARAAPDGYTIVMGSNANITTNPHLMALSYDPMKDLAPVAMLTVNPLLLFVNPAVVPVNSFKEFLAYVREQNGKADYASAGNGSPAHLSAELLKLTAGIRMVHVPYKGGPPGVNDVLGGRVLAQPEVKELLLKQGAEVQPMADAEFRELLRTEYERWGRVIREAKIRVD